MLAAAARNCRAPLGTGTSPVCLCRVRSTSRLIYGFITTTPCRSALTRPRGTCCLQMVFLNVSSATWKRGSASVQPAALWLWAATTLAVPAELGAGCAFLEIPRSKIIIFPAEIKLFSRAGFVSLVSCRCWCCGPVLGAGIRQGHRWIWVASLAVLGGGWRQVALLACSSRQLVFKVIRISGQVSTKLRAEEEPGGSPSPSEGSATIKHWLWTLFLCPAYRIRGVWLLELRLSKLA